MFINGNIAKFENIGRECWQAQKMESLGTLAGGVAHDLNNTLSLIQMAASEMKEEGDLSVIQGEAVGDILDAVKRSTTLSRQLLQFCGRAKFQPRHCDLNELISETLIEFKRIVGDYMDLEFNRSSQPMIVQVDSNLITQVMSNILANCRDAMPDGGKIIVEISGVEFDEFADSRSAQARVGAFAALSVTDSGCGIPPDLVDKVFDPFFTTKRSRKNTGLGLATVFGILQQHQGWVSLDSTVGQGTTVRMYIPASLQN